MDNPYQLLDPQILGKISGLELKAREVVEGFISGLHKSPYHGFSVEFAEHREYVPGDDIRHIDWKVYARSDRFYIKQYEEETNLIVYLLVDVSESMKYGQKISKKDYGSYLAASLAYLTLKQQDSVALATFHEDLEKYVPPSGNISHLKYICQELIREPAREKTNIGTILHRVAEKIKRRGIIILISDMLDDLENILFGLRHLRHKRHDVILFHVLDYDEVHFPFEELSKFIGMEEDQEILMNPKAIRDSYLKEMNGFCEALNAGCMRNRVDYVRLDTSQNLDVALSSYLASRIGRI